MKNSILQYCKRPFILMLVTSVAWFISCTTTLEKTFPDSPIEHKEENVLDSIMLDELTVKEIDGCEYIIYLKTPGTNKGFGLMAHKGNCKNPIHYYKELDSLAN